MKRNTKKYIIALFAAMMSAALFFVTALAQATVTVETDPISSSSVSSPGVSSSKVVSKPESGPESAPPSSDGSGNVDVPNDNETVPVKLNYNDGSKIKIVNVEPGTKISALAVPSRKGYVFSCWTMNGAQVSSTFEIFSEITLTAQWQASASSSRKPSSYASVDTHQHEVDQAASRAGAAISDPDVLSSEDWNSLLSTGSEASSDAGDASSQASSEAAKGGGSWLFPVGIALIVLSACGIGAFVYLQFFSGSGPHRPGSGSGPNGPDFGSGPDDLDDGMDFTDISSNSTGPYPAPSPEPKPSGTPRGTSDDDTMPIPRQARRRPERDDYDMSRSQARPVGSEKKDFDWDKFFNDDI